MEKCPVCGGKIPDDFGLLECPSCKSLLIIHMDGRVEFSGKGPNLEPGVPPPPPPDIPEVSMTHAPVEPWEENAAEIMALQNQPASSDVPPDLTEIAEFGNSDVSSAREGTLRYNIVVSAIDTSDVREAFRQALTDAKLVWDTAGILRSLKNGEVRLDNVTPAKAFMVVSRLRNLPVKVRWEQYAISQSS